MTPPIKLDVLREGLPTLTETWGAFLVEACSHCLETGGHAPGVFMELTGDDVGIHPVVWTVSEDFRTKYSWGDKDEAVEYGATCIAILLMVTMKGYQSVERSMKGTGIDYWVGDMNVHGNLPFQRKGRLEISGIGRGDSRVLGRRVKMKLTQAEKSAATGLPAHIVVVEFGSPRTTMVAK